MFIVKIDQATWNDIFPVVFVMPKMMCRMSSTQSSNAHAPRLAVSGFDWRPSIGSHEMKTPLKPTFCLNPYTPPGVLVVQVEGVFGTSRDGVPVKP
eukprot:303600-Pelagomonas_calceolata.AAC.2